MRRLPCLLLLLAAASVARAQPVSFAAMDDGTLFLQGKAAADAGDFERAVAYLTAYALRHPAPGPLASNAAHRAQVQTAINAYVDMLRSRADEIARLKQEVVDLGGAITMGMLVLPPLDVPEELEGRPPVDRPPRRLHPDVQVRFVPTERAVREDCIAFDPTTLELERDGSRWVLTDGTNRMMVFDDEAEGRRSRAILRRYRADRQCFVGRPDPSLTYVLVGDAAPEGAVPTEDCVAFEPAALRLDADGGRWLLTDGSNRMMAFDLEAEGQDALALIRAHGFTHTCYVGRPNPSMVYLRK